MMDAQQVLTGTQDALTSRRVFGEAVQVDGTTIIPVAVVRGGGGGGSVGANQAGAGFGVLAKPAGVYVIRNGSASWRPAVDVNRIVLGGQIVAMTALIALRPVLKAWLSRRDER